MTIAVDLGRKATKQTKKVEGCECDKNQFNIELTYIYISFSQQKLADLNSSDEKHPRSVVSEHTDLYQVNVSIVQNNVQ